MCLKRRTIFLGSRKEFLGPFGHFPLENERRCSRSTPDGRKVFHVMKGSSPPNKKSLPLHPPCPRLFDGYDEYTLLSQEMIFLPGCCHSYEADTCG